MTYEEIQQKKQRLIDIQKMSDSNQGKRYRALRDLAIEVGASTISTYHQKPANEGELADNIHQALQTATMIDMCKTASRNYVIALIATIIALGSAVALWIAVCK